MTQSNTTSESGRAGRLRRLARTLLTMADQLEESWVCDACGDRTVLPRAGLPCLAWRSDGADSYPCRGTYRRVDPEPDRVQLSDGRVLPVTTAELALEQAAQDFHLPSVAPAYVFDGDDVIELGRVE